ncbi:hypothetical protein KFU94_52465 [Chloroflexi bacterium TSY]|nr:hypothetical protein [Chloroflexi bacterium TSY]
MTAVEPGNQNDRGELEYYISTPFELPDGAVPVQISWQAELRPETWLQAQLRSARTVDQLKAKPWVGPEGENSWFDNEKMVPQDLCSGKWLQYRLALGSTNSGCTARVREVCVSYG